LVLDKRSVHSLLFDACGKLPLFPSLEGVRLALQMEPVQRRGVDAVLDDNGSTGLMYVVGPACGDTVAILELLVAAGACTTHRNLSGHGPVSYARAWRKQYRTQSSQHGWKGGRWCCSVGRMTQQEWEALHDTVIDWLIGHGADGDEEAAF
jgi:hypothetical protein